MLHTGNTWKAGGAYDRLISSPVQIGLPLTASNLAFPACRRARNDRSDLHRTIISVLETGIYVFAQNVLQAAALQSGRLFF
jgi:hypothetical protein